MRAVMAMLLWAWAGMVQAEGAFASQNMLANNFSYYSASAMWARAQSYLRWQALAEAAMPVDMQQGAEFRGYVLGKFETAHADWRNACTHNVPQAPDVLVRQVAEAIVREKDAGDDARGNGVITVAYGMFVHCMLPDKPATGTAP